MIKLYDANSKALIDTITEAQLQFLQRDLEEESTQDQDYYINQATVDWFEAQGADPALIALLRQALAGREDTDIRWERQE